MITLAQAIENRKHAKSPSEDLLGVRADEYAIFYENNWESLEVAKDVLLAEFLSGHNFNEKDLFHYRLGLDAFHRLFKQAKDDMDTKKELARKKSDDSL